MNEKLKKALKRQRELYAAAMAENRNFTEDEQREFDALQAVIDGYSDGDGSNGNGERAAEDMTPPPPEDTPQRETPPASADERSTTDEFTPESATEIMQMCRHFGMDAENYISRGLSVAAAREEIMNDLMQRGAPISTGTISVGDDERTKYVRAVSDGMLMRNGVAVANPAAGANQFRGMGIRDVAIECLERDHGGNYRRMSPDELYTACLRDFYNPTAAFPSILDDMIKKSYVEGLRKARKKYSQFVRTGSLTNFKKTTNHEYLMGLGGTLDKVPEGGELTAYVPLDVPMPERKLETFGRQFTMSREAFINDDIGLIATMPYRYAALSENTQNKLVYEILLGDKKIFDGDKMFSEKRGNMLKTGTGVTLAAIEAMSYMLGMQVDAAGDDLDLLPDLFIVPLGLGTPLKTLLYSPTIHTAENTQASNPYTSMDWTVVEDATINHYFKPGEALPWFMGMKEEFIQIDYLNGQKEATIRRMEKPGTLGFVWDVYHDFGVSVIHPQAIIKNPGVKLELNA